MTLKLRFDRHPDYPTTPVWTEDPALASVGGMLFSDFQSADSAREFAQRMREVMSGARPHFQGVGNGYLHAIFPDTSEVGLNIGEDPETVTVATADLIGALEEWATHLETHGRKLPEPELGRGATVPEKIGARRKSPARLAQGWHLESSGGANARVVESTRSATDRHGVYEAAVEIRDPLDGTWVRKDRESTFFPKSFSQDDVRRVIHEAYRNAVRTQGWIWVGTAVSGMQIVLVVEEGDRVLTAFPRMEPA